MNNCSATNNSLSGVVAASTHMVSINGGNFYGNGISSAAGNQNGINILSGYATIVGTNSIANSSTGIIIVAGTVAATTLGNRATVNNAATTPSNTGNYT